MSYSMHRYETLRRLGIEQLPVIADVPNWHQHDDPMHPFRGSMPVRTMPVSPVLDVEPIDFVNNFPGPWPPLSQLPRQRADCVGDTRQALPSVWFRGQLIWPMVFSAASLAMLHGTDVQ